MSRPVRLVVLTITVSAPLPFTDEDAAAFLDAGQIKIESAIAGAVESEIKDLRSKNVPLADVVSFDVHD